MPIPHAIPGSSSSLHEVQAATTLSFIGPLLSTCQHADTSSRVILSLNLQSAQPCNQIPHPLTRAPRYSQSLPISLIVADSPSTHACIPSPHPKAGVKLYPTTSCPSVLKHYISSAPFPPPKRKNIKSTYPPQPTHPLIQPWRKHAIHIQKHTLRGTNLQLLPHEVHHGLEFLGRADLEDIGF